MLSSAMHNLALAVLCLRRVYYLAELHELREQLFNLMHLAPVELCLAALGGESRALAAEGWGGHTARLGAAR